MRNKNLMPLRRLHGRFYEFKTALREKRQLKKYLSCPSGKKIYIIGTPAYSNLGDSAIAIAQMDFIKSLGAEIKEITGSEYLKNRDLIKKAIPKGCLICGVGGGNIGDQWLAEEQIRRCILNDFPQNNVVIFPQTVFFTPTESGEEEKNISVAKYNASRNLTLVAREQTSYALMQELFPNVPVLLTPDIVLSADAGAFGVDPCERQGVLLCFRSDAEKMVPDTEWEAVKEHLGEQNIPYRITDMYSEQPISKQNRKELVRQKMQEFACADLVITDRLHGMVFAAITGTPCIVFSNYNHKVKGTYDWIEYLPYVKYVETAEEAKQHIPDLLAMMNCHYDSAPLLPYFEKLAESVREKYTK